jgi:hypothetical protein
MIAVDEELVGRQASWSEGVVEWRAKSAVSVCVSVYTGRGLTTDASTMRKSPCFQRIR